MKKSGKFKLSLLGSIGVSLLAVSTAAVSTFAWFRAEADVQVSAASSDPVSITVSKPDDVEINVTTEIYAYNGNNSSGYTTALSNVSFTGNFTKITDLTTKLEGLAPSHSKTFCIKVTGDKNFSSLTLTITDLIDNADNLAKKRYKMITATQSSTDFIKMSEAIKFGGICCEEGETYTEVSTSYLQDLIEDETTITSNTLSSSVVYFYYTFTFVDSAATRYIEYQKDNENNFSPIYDSVSIENANTSDRYFLNNDNGNNSCFEGLSFTINEFEVSI